MPKLIIDNVEVEVPAGTNVLEAAKKVGIIIPHFCYHPALGSVGACRLCAMTFFEGDKKRVQVSCMVEAKDGMVVSTTDGDAAKLRGMVIEWLMLNHPHDCPVCDEGGMCLLQDYTIAGGHGIRRYKGKKRTFPDQYLGEFICQEMNRCIQCYRCVRFYQDYAGGDDFGTMQISNKTFFGRFREGWLESEFAGNLAEVCPTGVFTDKTYRYKARPWDLETAPSVCPHCSLGCNTIPGARYRKLLRVTARENQKVNGWFICDRGRFGYGFTSRSDRPYYPLIKGGRTERDAALRAASEMLYDVIKRHGPGSVAFMGSTRASLEDNFILKKAAEKLGSKICFSADPARERKDRRAASLLKGMGRSLKEVEGSDFIIGAGVDPVNEAPMLALLMRQAARKGADIVIIDPRPVRLPFKFTHVPERPDRLADALTEEMAARLGEGARPTIIAGTDVCGVDAIDRAASEVARLRGLGLDCCLFYVMSAANSFGAALEAGGGGDFEDILKGMEEGTIKALVVSGADPLGRYPDGERARGAFEGLEALVVMDCLNTGTVKRADVFLPGTAYAEEDGTFVNQEGRAQCYSQACVPGIPINEMGVPELHPPREFFTEAPGRSRPAWQWTQELMALLHSDIGSKRDTIGPVLAASFEYSPSEGPADGPFEGLMLLAVDLTFGTEELSQYSKPTQLRAPKPYVTVHASDANALGVKDGDAVEIVHGGTALKCALRVSGKMARGVAVAPKLHGFPVAALSGKHVFIRREA